MPNTTYFTQPEPAVLTIPDPETNPTSGFISSRGIPVAEGLGIEQPDQRLEYSTADGISERTQTITGRRTWVSWLFRNTINKYGVTKLPPKV